MPRAPPQYSSRARPRKRARPDPFVVLDNDLILEGLWTPPGSPSSRRPQAPSPPTAHVSCNLESPLRRAGPPQWSKYKTSEEWRAATRAWAAAVGVNQTVPDPRLSGQPAAVPAPSSPPRGTPPPPAPPAASDERPMIPNVPPPPSPIVVPSLPPAGPSTPVGSPEAPSSPAAPPPSPPKIPEILIVMPLPAAGFEVFAERLTTMLGDFLAIPGAQFSESRREILASFLALLAFSSAEMEEMMRMA